MHATGANTSTIMVVPTSRENREKMNRNSRDQKTADKFCFQRREMRRQQGQFERNYFQLHRILQEEAEHSDLKLEAGSPEELKVTALRVLLGICIPVGHFWILLQLRRAVYPITWE